MKPLNPKLIVKTIKNGEANFKPDMLQRITAFIAPYIEGGLDEVNAELERQHRRRLSMDEVAKIAYVHLRSISENEGGASPYQRVISYLAVNEIKVDRRHVKTVTDMLLQIELLTLRAPEDRKKKQCRRYAVSPEVQAVLRLPKI